MSDRNQLLAQIIANMGGGGGTTPDGTPVLEAAKEYTDEQVTQARTEILSTTGRFIGTFETLEDLKAAVARDGIPAGSWAVVDPVGAAPTTYHWDTTDEVWTVQAPILDITFSQRRKWAILPIAGQSNAEGVGTMPYTLSKENSISNRIFQLGRFATGTGGGFNVTEAQFNYGTDHDLMRPFADCNLRIIPAAPTLDHVSNTFLSQNGGTTSFGLNFAKKLLSTIGDEYDILIVPCARGASRLNPSGATAGTYDVANKRASTNSMHWSPTSALYRDLKDRVSHCLDLSPDTLLLPVIWIQGESDDNNLNHYAQFEALYDDFFAHIRDNYSDRCVGGDIDNFRWVCCSSTKWMWNMNEELDYKKWSSSREAMGVVDSYSRTLPYDNYAVMSKRKLNSKGEPHLNYVRIDINSDGTYVETLREKNIPSFGQSVPQIHFSSYGQEVEIPQILDAAIRTIGGLPNSQAPIMASRNDRSSILTKVSSNNHRVIYDSAGTSIPSDDGLVIRQNFANATTITDDEASFTGSIVTSQGSGMTLVTDPDMGQVLQMSTGGFINYSMTDASTSFTRSVVCRPDDDTYGRTLHNILSSANQAAGSNRGVLWFQYRSVSWIPNYVEEKRGEALRWSPAHILTEPEDTKGWYCITVVHNQDAGTGSLFVNGKRVQKFENTEPVNGSLNLGSFDSSSNTNVQFKGKIASSLVYNRALDDDEIQYIAYRDLIRHFE